MAVAWVLGDEESTTVAVLELVQQQGAVTAAVWWAEVRNALIRAERRGRMSLYGTEVALAALDALAIRVDELPTALVLALTRAHRLTVYDAMYLELALRGHRPAGRRRPESRGGGAGGCPGWSGGVIGSMGPAERG